MARSVISVALFLLGATFLLLQISTSECAERSAGEQTMADLPSAPIVFNSPDELRSYLEELDKYFAIAGRPRYFQSTSGTFNDFIEYEPVVFDNEDRRDYLEIFTVPLQNWFPVILMVQIGSEPSGFLDRFWPFRFGRSLSMSNAFHRMPYPFSRYPSGI